LLPDSHMARTNASNRRSSDKVKLKKYFYMLRPLLGFKYIEEGHGLPPVRFQELVEAVAPKNIRGEIYDLIELKRNTPEIGHGDAIPTLNDFTHSELNRHEGVFSEQGQPELDDKNLVFEKLNRIFRQAITEAFDNLQAVRMGVPLRSTFRRLANL